MIARIHQYLAQRRLARMVAQTRSSYAIEDYRKRRAAALKGRAFKALRESAR